ncbi:MAG: hypothetical protein ACKOWR_03745 [Micrococcales bacterium]
MPLNQILREYGIDRTYQFNSLTSNWVSALHHAESKGVEANPIRIGAKRVVLSASQQSRYRPKFIVISLTAISVACVLLFLLNAPRTDEAFVTSEPECPAIAIGDVFAEHDSSVSIGDWHAKFEIETVLGGLLRMKVSAVCKHHHWAGQVTAARFAKGFVIKKLAPID